MIKIGDEFRHKFSYTQEDVNMYAKISGDTNPLHIDADYAAKSLFGKRIIHGYLGGSVFTKIFGTLLYWDGNIYMKQAMSFFKPMFVDTEYEAVITVREIFPEKNRILFETVVIEPATGEATIKGEAMLQNKLQFIW